MKPEPESISAIKQVSIQLPRDFYEAAERRATSQGLDMQEMIARAIEAFLGIRRNREDLITKRDSSF